MLVSDKYGFIVACPTKTGTNSVRAIVDKWKHGGGSPRVLDLLTGERSTRHRIAPPPGKDDYTRYMLIRDPRDRLVSMYEYLRRKDWEWSSGEIANRESHYGREEGWLQLLRIIAAVRGSDGYFNPGRRSAHGKRPFMWTDTQGEMLDYLRGVDIDGSKLPWGREHVHVIRLERLESAWHSLLVRMEVDEPDLFDLPVTQRNATPPGGKLFGGGGGGGVAAYWKVAGASDLLHEIHGGGEGLIEELSEFGSRG